MPTEFTKRALIVITNGVKPQANIVAREVDSTIPVGADSFKSGLSASGSLPITHWRAGWTMTQAHWNLAVQKLSGNPNVWLYDAGLWTWDAILAQRGLRLVTAPMVPPG